MHVEAFKQFFLERYTNVHLENKCTKAVNEAMVARRKAPVPLDHARRSFDEKIERLLQFRNNAKMSWKIT